MTHFIEKWIDKLEGNKIYNMSEETALQIICENIIVTLGQASTVKIILLASSSVPEEKISYIGQCLSLMLAERNENSPKFIYAGNILTDIDTISKAAQCDTVILVEMKHESSITEVEKQILAYQGMRKAILGYIMV
jgi:hypothetical protein